MSADRHDWSKVLVITPAFNEEANVGDVVRRIRAAVPAAAVLVVDDGSVDRTAAVAGEAGAQVLALPYNLGVGGAMRVGYRFAERKGFDTVVQVDADGQHAPEDIPLLIDGLARADVVIGSRFARDDAYKVGWARRLVMRVLARRLSKITGSHLTDVTSGFRAVGPHAIEVFARTYPVEYLGDTVEALVIASRSGLRVAELPVTMQQRATGSPSQTTAKGTLYAVRAVLIVYWSRFQRQPAGRQLDADQPVRKET